MRRILKGEKLVSLSYFLYNFVANHKFDGHELFTSRTILKFRAFQTYFIRPKEKNSKKYDSGLESR